MFKGWRSKNDVLLRMNSTFLECSSDEMCCVDNDNVAKSFNILIIEVS